MSALAIGFNCLPVIKAKGSPYEDCLGKDFIFYAELPARKPLV